MFLINLAFNKEKKKKDAKKENLQAIFFIIFWHVLMFSQIFGSPQVKRDAINF